jgi:hypothetical protein
MPFLARFWPFLLGLNPSDTRDANLGSLPACMPLS